jgi:hypothetical protein
MKIETEGLTFNVFGHDLIATSPDGVKTVLSGVQFNTSTDGVKVRETWAAFIEAFLEAQKYPNSDNRDLFQGSDAEFILENEVDFLEFCTEVFLYGECHEN